jgi:hypothetical protein
VVVPVVCLSISLRASGVAEKMAAYALAVSLAVVVMMEFIFLDWFVSYTVE